MRNGGWSQVRQGPDSGGRRDAETSSSKPQGPEVGETNTANVSAGHPFQTGGQHTTAPSVQDVRGRDVGWRFEFLSGEE